MFERVHIDFAGPFQGAMFLVVVDAFSKWPQLCVLQSTTVTKTIEALRQMFAMYGLPEHIVADNYRMAQTTKWLPAILDYMKNVMSSISTCQQLEFVVISIFLSKLTKYDITSPISTLHTCTLRPFSSSRYDGYDLRYSQGYGSTEKRFNCKPGR